MEGGFQKSLQLFAANRYCVFENDICFDLLNVLDGKPKYANVPLSKLFARPCVDRPEVRDGGPDYATALLLELFSRAKCPPVLVPSRVAAVKVYG